MSRIKLVLLLFIISSAQAQQKYWVFHTPEFEQNNFQDQPNPIYCSDWINACSYYLTAKQVTVLQANGLTVTPVKHFFYQRTKNPKGLGFAVEQIKGQLLAAATLNGKGVKIGVIDGGFSDIVKAPGLRHISEEKRIVAFKDYIRKSKPADLLNHGEDTHGTEVVQLIGGYHTEHDILFGLATHATFYLARTDFDGYEKRIEEDNLIAAMEWMYEEGVEIINISLGYTSGYNDSKENYRPEQMDGKTSAVAIAVEHAVTEKGLLIVVAAGNEANKPGWNVLSTPGDAKHALTVGSSQLLVWDKARFSSVGPTFLDYIKPDIIVFSGAGTSFSAPVITGLAACIKQYDPNLSNHEIIQMIKESSHLYPYPNNYTGYGVPQCDHLLKILKDRSAEIPRPEKIRAKTNRITISLVPKEEKIVLLHKNKNHQVIRRNVIKPKRSRIKVKRPQNAFQTTILYDHTAKEIIWDSSR